MSKINKKYFILYFIFFLIFLFLVTRPEHFRYLNNLLIIIGSYFAYLAFLNTCNKNRMSYEKIILDMYQNIEKRAIDQPGLYSLLNINFPTTDRSKAKEAADNMILSTLSALYNDKFKPQPRYFKGETHCLRKHKGFNIEISYSFTNIPFEWKYVEDLYTIIWNFTDEKSISWKSLLRDAYIFSEQILCLTYNAYAGRSPEVFHIRPIMDEEAYETWVAYINDLGSHPVFLSAIFGSILEGSIKCGYALEMKKILFMNKKNKLMIHTIFPEMENPHWPTNLIEKMYTYTPKQNYKLIDYGLKKEIIKIKIN